jgi:hypothetical protein
MKKLALLTLAILVSLTLIGRPRGLNPREIDNAISDWVLESLREMGYTILPEVVIQDTLNRKGAKSNYEKYWEEKHGSLEVHKPGRNTLSEGDKPEFDDLYYQPSKDGKKSRHELTKSDTVEKEKKVIIRNYYNDNDYFYANHISRFYHGGFNYWYYSNPFYYNPWFYDDFYFGWNYPYFGSYYSWNYPYFWRNEFYFGYNWHFGWNRPYNHYGFNNYNYYNNYYTYYGGGRFQSTPNYGRRERPSNYTQNNPLPNRRAETIVPQRNRVEVPQQRVNPQDKPTYDQTRRSYTPSYEKPRMSTRPQYNNTRVTNSQNMENRRTDMGNMNRPTESRSVTTMPNSRREVNTQTRTYTPSSNRTYSAPS